MDAATNVTEQAPIEKPLALMNFSKRVMLKNVVAQSDGGISLVGQRLVIGGWVKSSRELKKEPLQPPVVIDNVVEPKVVSCAEVLQSRIPFFKSIIKVFGGGDHHIRNKLTAVVKQPQLYTSILQINDGSCIPNLQVLVDSTLVPPSQVMPSGVCILIEGILQQQSVQGKQVIELKAEEILHLGTVDQDKYPLSKKRVPLDMLRDNSAHFRPRTKTVASVMRIRNSLSQSTHTFFQNHGFVEVQVPIITTTDTEGSSKKFQVTTLLETGHRIDKKPRDSLRNLMDAVEEKSKKVEELKRNESNKEAFHAARQDLQQTTELASQFERTRKRRSTEMIIEVPKLNFSEDYFSHKTFLTVSGRLHLESYACALGNVYSFGPRFQAEKTDSTKSMPEMWMVELEMAFSHIEDAIECADTLLKFMCTSVLNNCAEDIMFLSKRVDKTLVDRLQKMTMNSSEKISYTQAVDILKKVTQKKFHVQVKWGNPLTEEHESYLADIEFKRPVVIYNHPKEIRPFYARLNNDGKTVASFDVVVPKVGTLIKGSQNEERLATLNGRMEELGLRGNEYEWCKDLRRHGTVKHSGFSLVFDRLVLYATGLNDVRDAVPFPRSCGKAFN
ncbi:hypothetical protein Leryth_000796 [Lithospermum erythrorhizon]|nr:hypothetical protein Leryth_000796 [Lithospermum erythrorhizon]